MSNDLSSSGDQQSAVMKSSNVLKAVLTTTTVIVGFMSAQFIGVVLLFSLLSGAGLEAEDIKILLTDNAWAQFAAIAIIEALSLGLVYYYLKITNRRPLKYLKLDKRPSKRLFGIVAIAYAAYFVVFIGIATLVSLLVPALDTEQVQQIGFEKTKGLDYVAVFLALAILPPLVEEIVFRGVLFQKLKQYLSLASAIIVTSIVFGLAHLEFLADGPLNWIAGLDTFIFSLFLIAVFIKTRSLYAAIALHALKNSTAFVFLFLI